MEPDKESGARRWGKVAASGFAYLAFLVAYAAAWWGSDAQSLLLLSGAAISMSTMATSYWLGSSTGSAKKDDVIAGKG